MEKIFNNLYDLRSYILLYVKYKYNIIKLS